jgi:riboflavin synthase alpha subunit
MKADRYLSELEHGRNVARSGALCATVQRWQSKSFEDVIEEAGDPDDFEEEVEE